MVWVSTGADKCTKGTNCFISGVCAFALSPEDFGNSRIGAIADARA